MASRTSSLARSAACLAVLLLVWANAIHPPWAHLDLRDHATTGISAAPGKAPCSHCSHGHSHSHSHEHAAEGDANHQHECPLHHSEDDCPVCHLLAQQVDVGVESPAIAWSECSQPICSLVLQRWNAPLLSCFRARGPPSV